MPQAARRITQDDIEANFERIQKAHEETERALRESIENTEKLKESIERTNNRLDESIEKSNTRLDESIEKSNTRLDEYIDKASRKIFKSIGGITRTIGKMSESMLIPNLMDKFKRLGFTFEIVSRRRKIYTDEHEVLTEMDTFLENTTQAMAVEVKTTLRRDEVDWHVGRMEKIRRHADLRGDKRLFYGAMAAAVIDDEIKRYALSQGFYLIEPSGEDIRIIEPGVVKSW